MLALTLPPIIERFIDWAEENPAMGAVAVLVGIVVLLWLLRKSIKFFMVICLLIVAVIVGSYFYYGSDKTNRVVRENLNDVIDEGKELVDKVLDSYEDGFEPSDGAGDGAGERN
jgi:hypothetical protein